MQVFSTSDLEADFRDPDELSRWLAIKSENGTNIVRDAFSRIVFARLGSKCIYCYKYFSLPIELTRSFNERLKTESDVENEFDLPPVDEIPLEQAESVE
ncbi:hypothetical protein RirG_260490 [Rhizophagus irregularis DAOM 197198w]|uniref:Uncharacterized protein n=1 Tax=Rhizophagus irregularis (strain DAOM 197198w) TaxID=1432141 RepID=A0A015L9Y1_RHIIW|nr:hypothetical protein RirG_260490 [Rhizophagus irregularis DAOM 197198w]